MVGLLLCESSNVIVKVKIDLTKEMLNPYSDYYEEKHLHLTRKYRGCETELEKRR